VDARHTVAAAAVVCEQVLGTVVLPQPSLVQTLPSSQLTTIRNER
jgi:hypothetical protein